MTGDKCRDPATGGSKGRIPRWVQGQERDRRRVSELEDPRAGTRDENDGGSGVWVTSRVKVTGEFM